MSGGDNVLLDSAHGHPKPRPRVPARDPGHAGGSLPAPCRQSRPGLPRSATRSAASQPRSTTARRVAKLRVGGSSPCSNARGCWTAATEREDRASLGSTGPRQPAERSWGRRIQSAAPGFADFSRLRRAGVRPPSGLQSGAHRCSGDRTRPPQGRMNPTHPAARRVCAALSPRLVPLPSPRHLALGPWPWRPTASAPCQQR